MSISVVIPFHQNTTELKRALNSVVNQKLQPLEVLVVLERVEEDLSEIKNQFKDIPISFLENEGEPNGNGARNTGIKKAKGTFLALLDSDDEWTTNHLYDRLSELNEKKADGIFGSMIIDNGNTQKTIVSRQLQPNEKMVNYLLSDGSAPTPTMFFKTDAIQSILFNESLLRHQDYDFSVRFAEKYKYIASSNPTCIVHWKEGVKRKMHIPSMVYFIANNSANISDNLYRKYFITNRDMLEGEPHLDLFIKQALERPKLYSELDYMHLVRPQGPIAKVYHKFKFKTLR